MSSVFAITKPVKFLNANDSTASQPALTCMGGISIGKSLSVTTTGQFSGDVSASGASMQNLSNNMRYSQGIYNWVNPSYPIDVSWIRPCWSPELAIWCVVSQTGGIAMTSSDGITWITNTVPVTKAWTGLCW